MTDAQENITELATIQSTEPVATGTAELLFDSSALKQIEHFSVQMAKGKSTLPAHLQGNPADCMAVTMQAMQWGMNPFAVAQKTHLVSGTLGYEAQLVNAVITSRAPVEQRLQFEWFGEWEKILGKFDSRKNDKGKIYHVPAWAPKDEQGLGVRVWATIKGEDEPRELKLLLVQAQVRNSTLWASDPKQQLAYLATKRWARLYAPDVILGVYTPDELGEPATRVTERDMGDIEPDQPAKSRTTAAKEAAKARRQASKKPPIEAEAVDVTEKYTEVIKGLENCETPEELEMLREAANEIRPHLDNEQRAVIGDAIKDMTANFAAQQ